MKWCYPAVVLFFIAGFPLANRAQNDFQCGASRAWRQAAVQHPEANTNRGKLEEFTSHYIANYQAGLSRSSKLIIPVVFHIIHQGGPENISDAQIRDGLRQLNLDFNKGNADTANVSDPGLRKIIADVGVEFRLANIDPQGNYTTGIDRIYSVQTHVGNHYSKLNGWPHNKYVNIWVMNSLGGPAGYAWYPGTIQDAYDGIAILHSFVGSFGTSLPIKARTLTHEMGHYLNLYHVWGDTDIPLVACGDDKVHDTPVTEGYTRCPTDEQSKNCNPQIVENYQNYMDYTYCYTMFTEGQKQRMLAALNAPVSGRSNLWAHSNLVATGVLDTPAQPAMVKADFIPGNRYACINTPVTFKNQSVNAVTYLWEFPNGVPASSSQQNPTVQFLNPGWQPVKLTVLDAQGHSSIKNDDFRVYVSAGDVVQTPFTEGFDDKDVFNKPGGWASANLDVNPTFFKQANVPHTGTGSAYLNNYAAQTDRDIDELISPAMDLTPLSREQMNLSFYYSWTSTNGNFASGFDSICVYGSNDCGKTWINLFKKGGQAVLGVSTTPWVPGTESSLWRREEISMSSTMLYNSLHRSNVRFKFQVYGSVGGNNFFIDDIQVGFISTTGIAESQLVNTASVFPNPSNSAATLFLQLTKSCHAVISLYHLNGKEISAIYNGRLNEGDNHLPLNTSLLPSGIYLLRIKAGEEVVQRKVVIQ